MALIVVCAWCLQERGQAPGPEETHGACHAHFAQLLAELRARRGEATKAEGPGPMNPGKECPS
jgi:hypothetical protein